MRRRKLDAEGYESNGKWEQALAAYKRLLDQYPGTPGIHYRLGRIILSMPATATSADEAKREFETELKIDLKNAAAEFMLGDLARQNQQWDAAIDQLLEAQFADVSFAEAYLGLGMMLNSVRRYAEAIPPLETYAKMQPDDAAAHYQLALAYARTGRER